MSFYQDLFTKLSGDAGVSALVGTRVTPNNFTQQDGRPAIRYARISTSPNHLMGGDANVETQTFYIDCIASTYIVAQNVASAVNVALSRWSSVGVVQDSFKVNERDDFDDEAKMHRVQLTYDFFVEV